jgi:hypothetical protein
MFIFGMSIEDFLVTMAERPHLFPYRTQQLSSPAVMVLPHLVVGE